MMENFFAIKLVLRFGTPCAAVLAVVAGVAALGLLWSMIGFIAVPFAILIAAFVFLLGKSYVELVAIVFQMVH